MRVAEALLAAVLVSLGGFVAMQAMEPAATARALDHSASAAVPTSDIADVGGPTALTSGQAEGRLVERVQFVRDVPRPDAWTPRELRRRLQQSGEGTYIDAVLGMRDSVIARWPDRRTTPVRVWVGDGGMLEGWHPAFPAVVREAFDEWVATGIPVRFSYVRDSADADVRVHFVAALPEGISGRTIWSRDSRWWIVSGEIALALTQPMGAGVTEAQLRAIALHEAGHLLGLDHVNDPLHIMAPRVRARALSGADIATIQLLYSVPAGSTRD